MNGIAGKRIGKPQGIVLHNDAGSQAATVAFYKEWLKSHPPYLGFAHLYVANDGIFQAEDLSNMAWHTANALGNREYIGIEICQSLGNLNVFLDNERKACQLVVQLLKKYNLPITDKTIKLHCEFAATACPHRSLECHGGTIKGVRDYWIKLIKQYNQTSSDDKDKTGLDLNHDKKETTNTSNNNNHNIHNNNSSSHIVRRVVGSAGVYQRKKPTTKASASYLLQPGQKFGFKGYVKGESISGNPYWFVGNNSGEFCWSGGFTDKSLTGLKQLQWINSNQRS